MKNEKQNCKNSGAQAINQRWEHLFLCEVMFFELDPRFIFADELCDFFDVLGSCAKYRHLGRIRRR